MQDLFGSNTYLSPNCEAFWLLFLCLSKAVYTIRITGFQILYGNGLAFRVDGDDLVACLHIHLEAAEEALGIFNHTANNDHFPLPFHLSAISGNAADVLDIGECTAFVKFSHIFGDKSTPQSVQLRGVEMF